MNFGIDRNKRESKLKTEKQDGIEFITVRYDTKNLVFFLFSKRQLTINNLIHRSEQLTTVISQSQAWLLIFNVY